MIDFVTKAVLLGEGGHFLASFGGGQTGPFAGVFDDSVFGEWQRIRVGIVRPRDWMTGTIGILYSVQNSKSRSSCAGTAMIAPVP